MAAGLEVGCAGAGDVAAMCADGAVGFCAGDATGFLAILFEQWKIQQQDVYNERSKTWIQTGLSTGSRRIVVAGRLVHNYEHFGMHSRQLHL